MEIWGEIIYQQCFQWFLSTIITENIFSLLCLPYLPHRLFQIKLN